MFVLGTAGHVDHGKSTLVQALSGIDPDRLREEKERGMTIDLGFAWLRLPSGREVSIVDVPGHERFIKNMLAGVGGIDLALLVVAADEGVMPQTREHLAILDLLRVSNGVVAVTKRDLVDDDWLDLVIADIEETLGGTALSGSPIIPVSAVTRSGLPELVAAIDEKLQTLPIRADRGQPRLPIDRVFSIAGFGTVVTGTLTDGHLDVGQEVEILPDGKRSRIRGLQTHRHKVERAEPGSRVAANIAGLSTAEVRRGEVLTLPNWLRPTSAIDVRLRAIGGLARPVGHNTAVTFHCFSSEVNAKVRLLEQDELRPGESGWAQIRTEAPIAVRKGDLFIIRTSNETIGGGEIVEVGAKRHRRFHKPTVARLTSLEQGSPDEILFETLRAVEPTEVNSLLRGATLPSKEALDALGVLVSDSRVRVLGGKQATGNAVVVSESGWRTLVDRVVSILDGYHRQYPLRIGMPREEVRSRLGISGRIFGEVVAEFLANGVVAEQGPQLRLSSFQAEPTADQSAEIDRYLRALRATPYAPPGDTAIDPELLAYLVETERVIRVSESVVFDAAAYHEMVARVLDKIRDHGKISVGEVRDMFSTSRKYALGLMEYLDERKITRRVGDDRVLR